MNKTAIIVPVYNKRLTELEKISLRQIQRTFENDEIIVLCPRGIHIEDDYGNLRYEYFHDSCFESVYAYNRLMLSISFYKRFEMYEYILICQLDVFVFENQLDYFCKLNYDYIGAPWIEGVFWFKDSEHFMWHVGNGGFSLRRVSAFIALLESKQDELLQVGANEDWVFSFQASDDFKVAPMHIALKFAFERNIKKCYELNNYALPFACHAWWRYDLEFLKETVERYGYAIKQEWIESGNEDKVLENQYKTQSEKNEILAAEYKKENFLSAIQQYWSVEKENFVIWGAGIWGKRLSYILKDSHVKLHYIVDINISKCGGIINGCEIISVDEFDKIRNGFKIIIAIKNDSESIVEELQKRGLSEGKDFITLNQILKNLKR